MREIRPKTIAAILFVIVLASPHVVRSQQEKLPKTDWTLAGDPSAAPYGWAHLCEKQRQECLVDVLEARDLHLTSKTWMIIQQVNSAVNDKFSLAGNLYHKDIVDLWDYPKGNVLTNGEFAIWKRKLLMERGFPRQCLLITIAVDKRSYGITLLTIKTDRGDFLLVPPHWPKSIYPGYNDTFTSVKRQSQLDPNVWLCLYNQDGSSTGRCKAKTK